MITLIPKQRTLLSAVLMTSLVPAFLLAQQTSPTPPKTAASDDDTIVLSPFVVSSTDNSNSYRADDTLAGARVRTNLKDLGTSISVVTKSFLENVSATDNASLLKFTVSTEVGGTGGNFGGFGNSAKVAESRGSANTNTRVRGLSNADQTTDYFITNIPWDSYNVDRVEIQRGPDSLLFGVGSPSGIVNTYSSGAGFKDRVKIENRVGQYGSVRNVADINKVLLKDELSLRVIGLDDDEKYQQKPAYRHQQRLDGALRFDPKFLSFENAKTYFTASVETGRIKSNNPHYLAPVDMISPWFGSIINKRLFNEGDAQADGVLGSNNANTNLARSMSTLGSIGNYAATAVLFNANSGVPIPQLQGADSVSAYGARNFGISSTGAIDAAIDGFLSSNTRSPVGYSSFANNNPNLPGGNNGVYKDKSIVDSKIFDFYNHMLDGDSAWQLQSFNRYNLNLSEVFFKGRLSFNGVINHETSTSTAENAYANAIGIDAAQNTYDNALATTVTNPNAGRALVLGSGYGYSNRTELTDKRMVGNVDLKAADFINHNFLARLLGRQVLTGLISSSRTEKIDLGWNRYQMDAGFPIPPDGSNVQAGDRRINYVAYLSPSLAGASLAQGLHLQPIQHAPVLPAALKVRYFDSHWNHSLNASDPGYINPAAPYTYTDTAGISHVSTQSENPANYVGWTTRPGNVLSSDNGDTQKAPLTTSASKSVKVVDSESAVWQGHFWDDSLVTTFGLRTDKVKYKSASAGVGNVPRNIDGSAPTDFEITDRSLVQTGNQKSWSIVYRLPKQIVGRLPGGTTLSVFYNRSSNFDVSTPRVDVEGNNIANPEGKTREIGFDITTLDNRLTLRTAFYRTTVQNATYEGGSGFGDQLYNIPLRAAWCAADAALILAGPQGYASSGYAFIWDYYGANTAGGSTGLNIDQNSQVFKDGQATAKAFINSLNGVMGQSLFDNYGVPINVGILKSAVASGNYSKISTAFGGNYLTNTSGDWNSFPLPYFVQGNDGSKIRGLTPVATTDTVSTGVEFELIGNITKNWNLSFNAARTDAQRAGFSAATVDLITAMKAIADGAGGAQRILAVDSSNTFKNNFYSLLWGPYTFALAQSGTSAPEISHWRANVVTNYSFDSGRLKGLYVGAALRWQAAPVLGYGLMPNPDKVLNPNPAADPNNQVLDISKPINGMSDTHLNVWVGYGRPLTQKIDWKVQLNVSDVGEKAGLRPITVEPQAYGQDIKDKSFWGQARIVDGMRFQVTNTFTF